MDLPKPPEDQELRNIIDKLAQFVARNGPEFEHMTKQKQKDNSKFSFLFGGEFFNYYQFRVTTEQAILKQKQRTEQQAIVQHVITQQSIQSAPWQQQQQQPTHASQQTQQLKELQDQIRQSEQNLAAQHQLLLQQQQVQVDAAIRKAQDEKLQKMAQALEINLEELDKVLQPIIEQCTKDAISAGKGWIFTNAITNEKSDLICQHILKRVFASGATFELKLHLIYLINDVLHHCVRKNADGLKKDLEKIVVPMFCTTSIGVDESKQQKLAKLLKLWETNNYFEQPVLEKMKNPMQSLASFQAGFIAEHAARITPVTAAIQAQYTHMQKQHQEYVTHLTSQIQQLQTSPSLVQQQQYPLPTPPQQQQHQQVPTPGVAQPAPQGQALAPFPHQQPPSMAPNNQQLSAYPHPMGNADSGLPPHSGMVPHMQQQGMEPIQGKGPLPMDGGGTQPMGGPHHMNIPTPIANNQMGGPPQQMGGQSSGGHMGSMPSGMAHHGMGGPSFGSQHMPPSHQGPIPNGPPPGHFSGPPPFGPHQFSQPPPNFIPPNQQGNFNQGPPPNFGQGPPQFPPQQLPPQGMPNIPDFCKPPMQNFNAGSGPNSPHNFPPDMCDTSLPAMPYYDLPAGLMVPLIRLDEFEYRPLNPDSIRLPPPAPPSERLIQAVELFYSPPTHERPRNSEGWEQLGLYEFFKAKAYARKRRDEQLGIFTEDSQGSQSSGEQCDDKMEPMPMHLGPLLPTPSQPPLTQVNIHVHAHSRQENTQSPPRRRYKESKSPPSPSGQHRSRSRSRSLSRSASRSRSQSRSRSRSRSPYRRYSRSRSRSRSKSRSRSRSGSRSQSRSRSPSPNRRRSRDRSPHSSSFYGGSNYQPSERRLDESNKGHQLLRRMGWSGAGLGATEQGIQDPVDAGEVRDRQDQYKGIGISLNDPYENFRKSKGQAFINRMKARAEELGKM